MDEAGFPSSTADGDVAFGAVGEELGFEDVARLLDDLVVKAVNEKRAGIRTIWPRAWLAHRLLNSSLDRRKDFIGAERDLQRLARIEIIRDDALELGNDGVDLPCVRRAFACDQLFQLTLRFDDGNSGFGRTRRMADSDFTRRCGHGGGSGLAEWRPWDRLLQLRIHGLYDQQ